MKPRVPIAWLQLTHSKGRLAAAIAGIGFAGLLMLAHMGVSEAMFSSAVIVHESLDCDLVVTHVQYQMIIRPEQFPKRRVYQALGVEGVDSVSSLHLSLVPWKNPWKRNIRNIFMIGFDPQPGVLTVPEVNANLDLIRKPDNVLFDSGSRPEFGPVRETYQRGEPVVTEIASRRANIAGLFHMGTSFGIDGTVITSDLNFMRMMPSASVDLVNLGLVKLKPGADIGAVQAKLNALLPDDVQALTPARLMEDEIAYWSESTPVGFSTLLGVVMGWIVGAVIVYQILYSDVTNHLAEYATLKAMGYSDRYLVGIVMKEALLLSVFGFLPSLLAAQVVYQITYDATLLPIAMTTQRAITVYGYILLMCFVSGLLASRQLRRADPAEIF